MNLLSKALVFGLKGTSKVFFRSEVIWHTPKDQIDWDQIRVAVVLNHTSLFEPLFVSAIPNINLWRAVDRVVVPVADVTMNRPLVGKLFRLLAPNAITITRRRDDSWNEFMEKVKGNSLILIFPEGRMKRKDGLDKNGKPMSVKGGIAEILQKIDGGKMMIAYSGGLHHVHAPGESLPKLFRSIQIGFEQVDINDYKKQFDGQDFRAAVIQDLEERMKKNTP